MYGIREFYDVIFTADYDIKMGDKIVPAGDILMAFPEVPKVQLQEVRSKIDAEGGQGNRSRVSWDETRGMLINFSQGVISKQQIAFLANSKPQATKEVLVPELEALYSDDFGTVTLKHTPVQSVIVYGEDNEKEIFTSENRTLEGLEPNTYYNFHYQRKVEKASAIKVGNRWIKGYLHMTAKAKMKDKQTGKIQTLFIDLPKVQLLSDLNIMLGSSNDVASLNFSMIAHPVGSRNETNVGRFVFLGGE